MKKALSLLFAALLLLSCVACTKVVTKPANTPPVETTPSQPAQTAPQQPEERSGNEEETAPSLGSEAAPARPEGEQKLEITVSRSTGEMTVTRPEQAESGAMGDTGVWTIFVYLCGTDLESWNGSATGDLYEMIYADQSDRVRFVVETGGTWNWENYIVDSEARQRFLVQNGEAKLVDEEPIANMGAAETLGDFLCWGVENYASEHMGVILWDHGGGSITGICFDERYDNDSLSLRDLDEALFRTYGNMTQKFDFFGFDACLMGTVEAANILASYADYMIGSQETEPGSGWDYTAIGDFLAREPDSDALALGRVICDSFMDSCRAVFDEDLATLSLVDLGKVDELLVSFNSFAGEMFSAGSDSSALTEMIRGIERADNFGGNNKAEGYTNMVDLGGLIRACAPYTDSADLALRALNEAIVYSVSGETHLGASGLSVYYPLCVQGSEELGIFGEVCVSPFYLSFVDRQNLGSVNSGDVTGYDDEQWFDDDGYWSWSELNGEEEAEYWSYLDDYEQTGESPLITFEVEPFLDDEGDYWFVLDDEGWYYAAGVLGYVFELSADGEDLIELGETLDVRGDWETGFFCDYFDGWWLSLPDGQNLALYLVEEAEDHVIYTSPIYLNDEPTNLRLRQNYEDGAVIIEGAWDGIDENGASARDVIKLQTGDRIIPRYYAYSIDSFEELEYVGWEYVVEGEPEICYDIMEAGDYLYAFRIDDIYGDYYLTDFVLFTVDENGEVYYTP